MAELCDNEKERIERFIAEHERKLIRERMAAIRETPLRQEGDDD